MSSPLVSVVTAVDRREYLDASLASVLGQTNVDLELIVVDDASTDGAAEILASIAARDARVRILRQHQHRGLTEALIVGCAAARGPFIARHDSDDISLPGRLELEAELLESRPALAMVGCGTSAVGPADEPLFEIHRPPDPREATRLLREELVGPGHHGSVMFRRDVYRRVGGYRTEFRYAQDWDLWLRLTELGDVAYAQPLLYEFRVRPGSISSRRRDQQRRLVDLAARCRDVRARGESEGALLREAIAYSREQPGSRSGTDNYFIGRCLLDRRDRRAIRYLARGLRERPWSLRRWTALAGSLVVCRLPQDPS